MEDEAKAKTPDGAVWKLAIFGLPILAVLNITGRRFPWGERRRSVSPGRGGTDLRCGGLAKILDGRAAIYAFSHSEPVELGTEKSTKRPSLDNAVLGPQRPPAGLCRQVGVHVDELVLNVADEVEGWQIPFSLGLRFDFVNHNGVGQGYVNAQVVRLVVVRQFS